MATAPEFGTWDPQKKKWVIEGYGVDPDVEVDNLPEEVLKGKDPQLERAIKIILEELKRNPKEIPKRPDYPEK